jgi:hypothetical protein
MIAPEHETAIAITIEIEDYSRKNSNRFPMHNQIPILKLCSVETLFFRKYSPPLRQPRPCPRSGAHAMPWNYREKNSPEFTYR